MERVARTRAGNYARVRSAALFGAVAALGSGGAADSVLIGTLVGANFNITTDQEITLKSGTWRITKIQTTNASTSMTTAAGGFYSAASKGGVAIVAASQAYSGMVNPGDIVTCTIAAYANAVTQLFFALTTGQGAAATADIYVYGVRIQ